MPRAMPDAYANALPQAMPNPQCTDGRTDGQDEEPPSADVNLKAVDVRRAYELSTIREVLEAGLWPSGERHPVVRRGERAEIPKHVRAAVWFRDGGRCSMCQPDAKQGEWHLDHIKPWSAGGPDTSDNLRVLCAFHNLERGNQVVPDERPQLPVTWWCERCYMAGEHEWEYLKYGVLCPLHLRAPHFCRVARGYKKALDEHGEFPTWHQRPYLEELHTTAYCAHCGMRGLTGVTL